MLRGIKGAAVQRRMTIHSRVLATNRIVSSVMIQHVRDTSRNQCHPTLGDNQHLRLFPTLLQQRTLAISTGSSNLTHEEETRHDVASDLFHQYAVTRDGEPTLDYNNVQALLKGVGEEGAHEILVQKVFEVADEDANGLIDEREFLAHSDFILGDNPARIILVVGGPGSGKGMLSKRLQEECHVIHLSSGELLREEVAKGTALGRQVQQTMQRGELVSSAVIVALMKQAIKSHPGRRVLLDGFPRSPQNAYDMVQLCGVPELALHLTCDDTILLERIILRAENAAKGECRLDDNFDTALDRIRTYHRYHPVAMEWLKEQHVPIVNLDCSGTPESVWQQLKAIGRLMRPSVKRRAGGGHPLFPLPKEDMDEEGEPVWDDWSNVGRSANV